ncbi:hypothetical protein SDC9_191630 [bioreactor metagenome]|uniref:Uncharacterized protein n=1 Tax=bioreactor metagenome TaxID=1076179 RepID=A0A645I0U8_9ZZZZ
MQFVRRNLRKTLFNQRKHLCIALFHRAMKLPGIQRLAPAESVHNAFLVEIVQRGRFVYDKNGHIPAFCGFNNRLIAWIFYNLVDACGLQNRDARIPRLDRDSELPE